MLERWISGISLSALRVVAIRLLERGLAERQVPILETFSTNTQGNKVVKPTIKTFIELLVMNAVKELQYDSSLKVGQSLNVPTSNLVLLLWFEWKGSQLSVSRHP